MVTRIFKTDRACISKSNKKSIFVGGVGFIICVLSIFITFAVIAFITIGNAQNCSNQCKNIQCKHAEMVNCNQ
jgi:Na+/proline symporter